MNLCVCVCVRARVWEGVRVREFDGSAFDHYLTGIRPALFDHYIRLFADFCACFSLGHPCACFTPALHRLYTGGYTPALLLARRSAQVDILDPALLRPGRFDRQVFDQYLTSI